MQHKKTIKTLFIVVAFSAISFGLLSFTKSDQYFEIAKNIDIFTTLYKELNTYYVDDIQPAKMMRTGIDAMLKSLDPYTDFISEAEMEDYRFQTTGKYGGIGSLIMEQDGYVVISEPYEGSPSQKAGVLAGDKILKVDGRLLKGKTSEDVSKALKGQPNTTVELTVLRLQADGTEKEIALSLNREEIHVNNVPYYGMINNDVGYILLEHFYSDAGKEVRDALQDLKNKHNPKSVILDLRGNPGGLLNEAVNVSNAFIDKDENVVFTKGKVEEWDKSFKTMMSAIDKEIPLVVLTNSGSASASEIVSGSIQDLDRGVLVGQLTYGKGLVQTTRPLSYNTKLKVTTAKYYIPSGRCIQAINYAEKGPEGEVKKIPDSLKVAFKTRAGRVVYDGGGVEPDVKTEPEMLSLIAIALLDKNLIFNYATQYRAKHPSINKAIEFKLSDAEFEDFVAYISKNDYEYKTESEKTLNELEKISKEEKYYDAIKAQIIELHKKLDVDKKNDIYKQKAELMSLLQEEIAERYYYRKGRIEASFINDKEVQKAIEVLNNTQAYKNYLLPKK
jgi:carboxyl-terminal processing protease